MKALTIFALFGTLFMFTACGGNGDQNDDAAKDDAAQEEVQSGVVYYCPMECEGDKTYDEPGTCPVCGMDLVEKHADGEHMHEGEGHMHEGDGTMHEGDQHMHNGDQHMEGADEHMEENGQHMDDGTMQNY